MSPGCQSRRSRFIRRYLDFAVPLRDTFEKFQPREVAVTTLRMLPTVMAAVVALAAARAHDP
jgi:hypothetical protein